MIVVVTSSPPLEGEGLGVGCCNMLLNRILYLLVNPTPNPSPAMGGEPDYHSNLE